MKFGVKWLVKVGNLIGKVVDGVRAGILGFKGKPPKVR